MVHELTRIKIFPLFFFFFKRYYIGKTVRSSSVILISQYTGNDFQVSIVDVFLSYMRVQNVQGDSPSIGEQQYRVTKVRRRTNCYSRNGCQKCKQVHLKCDESYPICGRCSRLHLQCVFKNEMFAENLIVNRGELRRLSETFKGNSNQVETNLANSLRNSIISKTAGGLNESADTKNLNQIADSREFGGFQQAISLQSTSNSDMILPSSTKIQSRASSSTSDNTAVIDKATTRETQDITPTESSSEHNFGISLDDFKIDDLIDIVPNDVALINMLGTNGQDFWKLSQKHISEPNLYLFRTSWRSSSALECLQILERFDPIIGNMEKDTLATSNSNLLDFVWTLCRETQFFYNFVDYPEETFNDIMNIFLVLTKRHNIIENTILFNASVFLTTFYSSAGMPQVEKCWDKYVRIPMLRKIITELKTALAKRCSFSELVTLAFSVAILFSVNSCDPNGTWRSNLRNCYTLMRKAIPLVETVDLNNDTDKAALDFFHVLREWFFNVEFLAMISSDNGGEITKPTPLEVLFAPTSRSEYVTLKNGINVVRGYSMSFNRILQGLYDFINHEKSLGINLSGTNILGLIYLDNYSVSVERARAFGYKLLRQIDKFHVEYRSLGLKDIEMEITLKMTDITFRKGTELYVIFFLIGEQSPDETKVKLIALLESIFAAPYYDTCGVTLHWVVYVGGLISLVINNIKLYQGFASILRKIASRGMYVGEKSLERLEHIRNKIAEGKYTELSDPHQDYILF